MNIFKWMKFKIKYREKIKDLSDESLEPLIEKTIRLFPETIDISDGSLQGKQGFYSKKLSDAWHNAEVLNEPYSGEIDFMIWAIYGVLHSKSKEKYKKGFMSVNVLSLSYDKIKERYIKSSLEADVYNIN